MAALVLGCGSAPPERSDAGPACPPRTHPSFPQVPYKGGALLRNPELVTITFGGFDLTEEVGRFGDWIVGSDWLTTVGAEYGIGAGTHAAKVALTDSAPSIVSLSDIAAFLDQKAREGTIPRPSAGGSDLIYVLYYPDSTTLQLNTPAGMVGESCMVGGLGGLHSHGLVYDVDVPFAVAFECTEVAPLIGLTPKEFTEVYASHEIFEAATDPFPDTSPGYALDPMDPWGVLGSELGDLCVESAVPPTPEGFRAQRIWSNAAAQDGGSPCIPIDPSEPYFNVFTSPTGPLSISAGGSTNLVLEGWSTHPGTSWVISDRKSGAFSPTVSPSLSGAVSMSDCTELQVTVGVPWGTPSGSQTVLVLLSQSPREPNALSFFPISIVVP